MWLVTMFTNTFQFYCFGPFRKNETIKIQKKKRVELY